MKDQVLVVDDDEGQADFLAKLINRLDCVATAVVSPSEALELVERRDFDVVLTDLGMPEMDGNELCARVHTLRPDVPVIIVTAMGSMDSAVAAMRAGAYDFLTKPVEPSLLALSLARALEHHRLKAEVGKLREWVDTASSVGNLIGRSAAMRDVKNLVSRIGPSDATVLVHGETGTGKELVARALHEAGARKAGPFVAINCAALPATLLESELFGHSRGAFTDAKTSREGLFVKASGGTLFLDEIGEMPLEMQAKLLRALQERRVRPVGADTEIEFDVRVVTATNRDLEAEVAAKRFREDLYYRVNVVCIEIPPLRDRPEDVLPLATHFLAKAQSKNSAKDVTFSPEVAQALLAYHWPGNVRELENCMERAAALARLDRLTLEDLPDRVRSRPPRAAASLPAVFEKEEQILTLEEAERRYVMHVLRRLEGNQVRTAEMLGVDRRTLSRRIEKYEQRARAEKRDRVDDA